MPEIGDKPIEPQYRELMQKVGRSIDVLFNGDDPEKKTGFILLVFPFDNNDGRCNYLSNAGRRDVLRLLREQVKRFEQQFATETPPSNQQH